MKKAAKELIRIAGDVLYLVAVGPVFLAGYLFHKIWKYVSAGFMAGWITSRDLDE